MTINEGQDALAVGCENLDGDAWCGCVLYAECADDGFRRPVGEPGNRRGTTPFVSVPKGNPVAEKTIGTGPAAVGIVVSGTCAREPNPASMEHMRALE